MHSTSRRCVLISDFNINNLAGYLHNDSEFPAIEVIALPFSVNLPMLMQKDNEYWLKHPDSAIVWTQPDSVIKPFKELTNFNRSLLEGIFTEVDSYTSLLVDLAQRLSWVFVPAWVFPPYHRGFGMLDMKADLGLSNTLMRMNLRLADNLKDTPNVILLDAQRWIASAGKRAFDPKLWYMAKIPYGPEVFAAAVKDIKAAFRGIGGLAKKLIIVDLDNTLWGEPVGDVGVENIRLGGHDYIGEAYVDFQWGLKSLRNRGILLAIVSKNEEANALQAIDTHPEMVLRSEDFVGWKINWGDKAHNIVDLVSELNLGLDSVIFIDDDPVERLRVRDALPEVFVPDWPADTMLYKSFLLSLPCFDSSSITEEDIQRTAMYNVERQRQDLKSRVQSVDDWLRSLHITVKIEQLNTINLQRTVQLLNKTNQMNLTTRRMSESELLAWVGEDNRKLWTFRVADRFGDLGLTGILSLEANASTAGILDFVLSCRVMGRGLEEIMLYTAINHARSLGISEIYARYVPTAQNKPCLRFFERSGFDRTDGNRFSWKIAAEYAAPGHVLIQE